MSFVITAVPPVMLIVRIEWTCYACGKQEKRLVTAADLELVAAVARGELNRLECGVCGSWTLFQNHIQEEDRNEPQ